MDRTGSRNVEDPVWEEGSSAVRMGPGLHRYLFLAFFLIQYGDAWRETISLSAEASGLLLQNARNQPTV